MAQEYDVIVIGGGPGGYVAAIRCAQLGLKTACIDAGMDKSGKKPALGGTCLNVGCIPSKALLDSSHHFEQLAHLEAHGITVGKASMDAATMVQRKDGIVSQLTGGIAQLFKANKVAHLPGFGQLLGQGQVRYSPHDGKAETLACKQVILAAGSVPVELPFLPFDHKRILDNADILNLEKIPRKLGIIGAGVIGLEMGTVWRRLGTEVTILEAMDTLLPPADADIRKQAARIFKQQGLDIRLGAKVTAAKAHSRGVNVDVEVGGKAEQFKFDYLLVAVGRKPASEGLLAEGCGVEVNERGQVVVDDLCRTGVDGVWAIGDLVRGPMLAHKASEEGIAVAERIVGQKPHVDFDHIPWVIYTHPEIAWAGKTEAELKAAGIPYSTGSFPFAATGRALAMGEQQGLVKMLAHAETDRILGVHIFGPQASELIAEAVVAMEFAGSSEDLARIVHAHPTLSEAMHEAALAVDNRAIHKANRR